MWNIYVERGKYTREWKLWAYIYIYWTKLMVNANTYRTSNFSFMCYLIRAHFDAEMPLPNILGGPDCTSNSIWQQHIHNFYQKIPPDYILPLPHSVPNRILCMDDGIYPLRSFSTAGEKLGEKEYKKIYSQFGWLESFEIFVFRFYFSFDTFSLCRVVRSKYRSQNGEIRWSLLQSSCAISFQLYILAVFGACTNPILFISSFGAVWLAAYSHLGIGIVFFARLFDGI